MGFELIASMSNILPSKNQKLALKGRRQIFSSDDNSDSDDQIMVPPVAENLVSDDQNIIPPSAENLGLLLALNDIDQAILDTDMNNIDIGDILIQLLI